ncbi:hypothetical protein D3C75_1259160 [compost metagenome]
MGVDHIDLCAAGTGQFHRFMEYPVVQVQVLVAAMEGVYGGDNPAREGACVMADEVQRHLGLAQQMHVQRGKHQS